MKRLDITNKAITLLVALSVVYAILEKNIVFLGPLITLAIPYKFIKQKGDEYYSQNKNTLNNLFLFNIVSFIGITIINKNMNQTILDLVVNIAMAFVYYRIMISIENKQEKIYKNPEAIYTKINQKIEMLQSLIDKMKEDMESSDDEKYKNNLKIKIEALNQKIVQNKSQLEIIKMKIDSQNNNLK